jgi:hypothetical protein
VIITDSINIQSFWYIDEDIVDKYFVIDELTKHIVKEKFNLPDNKITVSFFPVLPETFVDKEKIEKEKILILLTGLKDHFVKELLKYLSLSDDVREVKILK